MFHISNTAILTQQKLYTDTTDANLTTGTWYHIAVTWTTPQTVAIYVNGDSKTLASIVSNNIATFINGSASFIFGYEADETKDSINGKIDDVQVFNRSLSQTEIRDIYNFGLK